MRELLTALRELLTALRAMELLLLVELLTAAVLPTMTAPLSSIQLTTLATAPQGLETLLEKKIMLKLSPAAYH